MFDRQCQLCDALPRELFSKKDPPDTAAECKEMQIQHSLFFFRENTLDSRNTNMCRVVILLSFEVPMQKASLPRTKGKQASLGHLSLLFFLILVLIDVFRD